jgi:rod shape-determining protein MreD
MRKTALPVVVLGLALVLQLTVLNGLRLPGGGVPDLVLVLVAALAMADGPIRGMVAGFAAGLCLDLAPPGSALLGEYALVFCLVGWAAGKLSGLAARSALLAALMLAVVVALGEALAAGLGLALDPAQVSWTEVRQILPFSVGYDLLIVPFALWLVVLARGWMTAASSRREPRGVLASAGTGARGRAGKQHQPRQPRLVEAAARPHDGWVGSGPGGLAGRNATSRRPAVPRRLHAANGVAGSAVTGSMRRPARPAPEVHLRLAGRRRRDGAVGNAVGSGLGRPPGRHPGLRTGASRNFRPHAGVPGGSAAMQSAAFRQPGWRRPVSVSFSPRRGDASVGRLLGSSLSSLVMPRSRRIAAPRFRRQSSAAAPGLATRLNSTRTLDQQAIMSARRRNTPPPRLHLRSGRRGDAMVGGSAHGVRRSSVRPASPRFRTRSLAAPPPRRGKQPRFRSRSPAAPPARRGKQPRFRSRSPAAPPGRRGKQPNFGYGRHSLLSFLTGRRIGGRWLASSRVGTRSGVWILGRRTGGAR